MTKQCGKCKEIKLLKYFNKNKTTKDGHNTWCKNCHNIYTKQHYEKNPETYRKANRKCRKKRYARLKATNPEILKEESKKQRAYSVKNLSNYYVKKIIVGKSSLKFSDITDEMVEFKKEHIKLIRAIKDG